MQPAHASLELGVRTFEADDQRRFASLSGDVNPIHMDALAARRLLSGRPVVHGMHVAATLLERWAAAGFAIGSGLHCEFAHPVNVGDQVHLRGGEQGPLRAMVGEFVCAELAFDATTAHDPAWEGLDVNTCSPDLSGLTQPLEDSPGGWVGRGGNLRLLPGPWGEAFPALTGAVGATSVAGLGALSYIVGMVCPGLHSIFSSLSLAWGGGDVLRFVVVRHDPRYRIVDVRFEGAVRGTLRAFVRPEPRRQPTMEELLPHVSPNEFVGRRCLVVGGSRGLGELTAKLLAAGGAEVVLTYAQGADDAARVAADIAAADRGRSSVRRYRVGTDEPAVLAEVLPVDAVFYFATTRIARRSTLGLDMPLLEEFLGVHALGFERLCCWLAEAQPQRSLRVFYPSSVYVAERPRGMTEYAMAKAAAEVLARDLPRTLRTLEVVCERLPRLDTDQTATLVAQRTASGLETLLPLVRRVAAGPAA
jgi:NAD(P)-dependent dehydrogenase (short-subunit alcohol dehydrogenase family)